MCCHLLVPYPMKYPDTHDPDIMSSLINTPTWPPLIFFSNVTIFVPVDLGNKMAALCAYLKPCTSMAFMGAGSWPWSLPLHFSDLINLPKLPCQVHRHHNLSVLSTVFRCNEETCNGTDCLAMCTQHLAHDLVGCGVLLLEHYSWLDHLAQAGPVSAPAICGA